jgi:hypothetical protein
MHLITGEASDNSAATLSLYAERDPQRGFPSAPKFHATDRASQSPVLFFSTTDRGRLRSSQTVSVEEHTLRLVEENPPINALRIQATERVASICSTWTIYNGYML